MKDERKLIKIPMSIEVIEEFEDMVLGILDQGYSQSQTCFVIVDKENGTTIAQENWEEYIYEVWNAILDKNKLD